MGFEIKILDAIQGIRTPLLDFFMPIITDLGKNGWLWILLAAIMVCFKKTRKMALMLGLALIIEFTVSNLVLKPLVARIRPFEVNQAVQLLVSRPEDYSFPSGHTGAGFAAAAAFLAAGWKRSGIAITILASLIAFTRLYLYVHYPTDVLGGIVLGVLCGIAGVILVKRIEMKIQRRRESTGTS